MRYGSVCSGIEAASAAWHPLGWRASFLSEIEAFPRAVLAHHYTEVPLHGDFTTIQAGEYEPIDLLVGGTPCQSFSIAGLRGGLDDERGNLALEYLRLADRLRPRWLVWENVPGVLSSDGGRDFGSILGGLVELGYGFAYRVLDAQFFGVAQRRRRVFVVGYLGDWRRAAAVLFERHSLQGHPAPSREAREGSPTWPAQCAPTLNAAFGDKQGLEDQHALSGAGLFVPALFSIMPMNSGKDYKAREVPVSQPIMAGGNPASAQGGDVIVQPTFAPSIARALTARYDGSPCDDRGPDVVAFALRGRAGGAMPEVGGEVANALRTPAGGASVPMIAGSAVRRLTPRECERLQGFKDDYTLIPWRKGLAPDGPRYKALGNSMAVPVMRWIGERIEAVEALSLTAEQAA